MPAVFLLSSSFVTTRPPLLSYHSTLLASLLIFLSCVAGTVSLCKPQVGGASSKFQYIPLTVLTSCSELYNNVNVL
jgi:hypothetical protein